VLGKEGLAAIFVDPARRVDAQSRIAAGVSRRSSGSEQAPWRKLNGIDLERSDPPPQGVERHRLASLQPGVRRSKELVQRQLSEQRGGLK